MNNNYTKIIKFSAKFFNKTKKFNKIFSYIKYMKLDRKDKLILYTLDFNARLPYSLLAKRIGISKEVLIYRIKRLEKEGIISGYYIVPNTPKLGLVSYKILIKYQTMSEEREKEMIEFLKNARDVGWVVETEGVYDLMFIVWTKNEASFDKFWTNFLNNYSQYFYEKEMLILTENHACRKEYLIEDEKKDIKEVFCKGEAKNECDEIDSRIIYELSRNARIPIIELSRKIGLTAEGTSYRIKQLVKKQIIQAFRPKINLDKIGYLYYNILIKIKDFSVIPKLFLYARNNEHITYYVKYLGKYDIGLDVEVSSPKGFRSILEEIRRLFGNQIMNHDFVRIINEIKITYGYPFINKNNPFPF